MPSWAQAEASLTLSGSEAQAVQGSPGPPQVEGWVQPLEAQSPEALERKSGSGSPREFSLVCSESGLRQGEDLGMGLGWGKAGHPGR